MDYLGAVRHSGGFYDKEITGARILIPIHIEDAYSGKYDPTEYVYQVNKACEERNILGRMMFMERGQWYQFSTMVSML